MDEDTSKKIGAFKRLFFDEKNLIVAKPCSCNLQITCPACRTAYKAFAQGRGAELSRGRSSLP